MQEEIQLMEHRLDLGQVIEILSEIVKCITFKLVCCEQLAFNTSGQRLRDLQYPNLPFICIEEKSEVQEKGVPVVGRKSARKET